MKQYLLLLLVFLFALPLNTYAISAQNCTTLSCVRKNIDNIDAQMVALLGQRLTYVKRAGELKAGQKPIYDPQREALILATVGKQAQKQGYSPEIAQAMFKTILKASVKYETTNSVQK